MKSTSQFDDPGSRKGAIIGRWFGADGEIIFLWYARHFRFQPVWLRDFGEYEAECQASYGGTDADDE